MEKLLAGFIGLSGFVLVLNDGYDSGCLDFFGVLLMISSVGLFRAIKNREEE